MSVKVRASIEFVKSNSIENTREVENVYIVGGSEEELKPQVSDIVDAWVSTTKDDSGKVIFQCYLKNVKYSKINTVKKAVLNPRVSLSKDEMFDFINNNQVIIKKDTRSWVDDEGNSVKIDSCIKINNRQFDGMTLEEAITCYNNS